MKLMAGLTAAALLALAATGAIAQDFPNRPVTWVVGFPPGGISDQGARMVAKTLSEKLGQTVIVENKPGAGGIVARRVCGRRQTRRLHDALRVERRDGGQRLAYKKLSYDPLKSFTLVHGFGSSPLVLVVPAEFALQDAEGTRRAREEESRQAHLRLGRQRHGVAPRLRTHVQAHRHHHDPHPLQGLDTGIDRSARRPHRSDVRLLDRGEAADRGRQAARAGADRRNAHGQPSRTCRPSSTSATRTCSSLPGQPSSARPACRSRSSTSSQPPSTPR